MVFSGWSSPFLFLPTSCTLFKFPQTFILRFQILRRFVYDFVVICFDTSCSEQAIPTSQQFSTNLRFAFGVFCDLRFIAAIWFCLLFLSFAHRCFDLSSFFIYSSVQITSGGTLMLSRRSLDQCAEQIICFFQLMFSFIRSFI